MAHDTARVSPRLHQTHENWEASHDFPRFSDVDSLRCPTESMGLIGLLRKLKRSKMSSGDIQLVSCRLASKSQIKNSGQRAENF